MYGMCDAAMTDARTPCYLKYHATLVQSTSNTIVYVYHTTLLGCRMEKGRHIMLVAPPVSAYDVYVFLCVESESKTTPPGGGSTSKLSLP